MFDNFFHKAQWEYIAKNPGISEHQALYELDFLELSMGYRSFACAYCLKDCTKCPLDWPDISYSLKNPGCTPCLRSYYANWVDLHDMLMSGNYNKLTLQMLYNYAMIIYHLPIREFKLN